MAQPALLFRVLIEVRRPALMTTCRYCGRQNIPGTEHCHECGTDLLAGETRGSFKLAVLNLTWVLFRFGLGTAAEILVAARFLRSPKGRLIFWLSVALCLLMTIQVALGAGHLSWAGFIEHMPVASAALGMLGYFVFGLSGTGIASVRMQWAPARVKVVTQAAELPNVRLLALTFFYAGLFSGALALLVSL